MARTWRSYGVKIVVSVDDISSQTGCAELINEAIKLGPVEAIYNLAVALRDAAFENQTKEMFKESLAPKALATKHLDELSRKLCPEIKHFVVFSSVSCGRGNAGQSNYGMANSIMERIIERRMTQGLPAKAIQWGAIGDVGLLAELDEKSQNMEIGGTLPQGILSCLEALDTLLNANEPIVASMVVAEKRVQETESKNVIDVIMSIMSIRDKKTISMDSTLSQLGMDSLTGVEVQQVLERNFNVILSGKEMRALTLRELESQAKMNVDPSVSNKELIENKIKDSRFFPSSFGDDLPVNLTILKLESAAEKPGKKILIIPGIEGMVADAWYSIAKCLSYSTFILHLRKANKADTLEKIVEIFSQVNILDVKVLFIQKPFL